MSFWQDVGTLSMVMGIMYAAALTNAIWDWGAKQITKRHTMKVQVFQIFFKGDGDGALTPMDSELYGLAVKYAADYMADPIDFTTFKNSWIACEVDADGKPLRALGILGMVLRADFTMCRFTDKAAVVKLVERAAGYLHDVYGARGSEALVYINPNDSPEMRCPDRDKWLEAFEMLPANRYAFKIR